MDLKYERLKVIGKGSFGKAYLVRNTEADALCVVKQMDTGTMDPKDRDAAVKEATLLKKMRHPNIVQFQEVFMTRKGRLCIVMDYADGGDLNGKIKKQGGLLLPESQVLLWFVQCCFALLHVHDRKVLHRDLKTQNIFLMSSGQVKLGDFGIARILDATKDYAKTMVGTPYYLSPEIIQDRPYAFKSDVWSLGIVLYEMATLTHPFDADSLAILAGKILNNQIPALDTSYSQDIVSLIHVMLDKNEKNRPAVREILKTPFLNKSMHEANNLYSLGLELSEFNPAPVSQDDGKKADDADGGEDYDEYEENFEDYSGGSEDEAAEQPNVALSKSVANLRLAATTPTAAAQAESAAGDAAAAARRHSGVGTKADVLRKYLVDQTPAGDFEKVYSLVRAEFVQRGVGAESSTLPAGGPGAPAVATSGELQQQVSDLIGAEKATALLTMFQLLCFLEDVATGTRLPSPSTA
eukprot:TRINITY_DN93487_c0_g1_i1.p1 TRINITY_DN93487_c0_g1~~TRINITY_DN93487_c0_g1_i1.p1  ORF type:complete len:466 (+),score=123.95 TRINITY_DN93487_c0_g1_i1:93-1490(+)